MNKDKLIYGVGRKGTITIRKNGKRRKSYQAWRDMIRRCYDLNTIKDHPTYKDCTVHEDWHYYPNFKKWYDRNYREGYQLDKDILIPDNKIYSDSTCVFVPKDINCLLAPRHYESSRGKYSHGVTVRSGKYIARISEYGIRRDIGRFNKAEEAFEAYKVAKEGHVKDITSRYYCEGKITWAVRNALHNFVVK